MNVLDKTIAFFDPAAGRKRAENRMAIKAYAAYEAANTNPRDRNPQGMTRGIRGQDGESKALTSWDRLSMVREISDLYRNDGGLIATLMTRLVDHVVGQGIFPQARTSSAEWNEAAEQYFISRSRIMDHERRSGMSFIGAMQKLLLYDLHFRGESFARPLTNGKLQWHEAETCMDPADKREQIWEDGIHLSQSGMWLGANFKIGGSFDRSAVDMYVPREQLFHAHSPFYRARQRRGIPVLAPIVPRMQRYQQTLASMQMKVDLESQQTLKVTGKGDGGRVLNDAPFGGAASDNANKQVDKIKLDSGMMWDLPEDRDIGSVETRTPSGEHMQYMTSHLEAICACVGIPHAIALMLVGGSYSATRGQMLAFEHTVARLHNYVVDFSQKVWNWTIAEAIRKGDLPPAPIVERNGINTSDFWRVEWTHPARLTLSPLEDQKVYDARFARGDMTFTAILKQSNKEREDVWNETEAEIRDASERASKLSSELGYQIPIEWFFNKSRPGGGNPATGTTKPKEEEVLQ